MNTKQDSRKLDLLGKEDLRRRTVRAVIHEGLSKAEAARVFGVSRTSVHSWIDLCETYGEDGLTPKRPGRPKGGGQLKGWQAATIVNIIKDHCPEQLKMPCNTSAVCNEIVQELRFSQFCDSRRTSLLLSSVRRLEC